MVLGGGRFGAITMDVEEAAAAVTAAEENFTPVVGREEEDKMGAETA